MFKIFIDMDGVLTNFDKQAANILDIKPSDIKDNNFNNCTLWKKINKAGPAFWSSMEWLPNAEKLWNFIKYYNPIILTTPSEHPSSIIGKSLWIENNLGNVPFIFEKNKEIYAKHNHILIDDKLTNINKWKNNNGIAILHKNPISTIKKLKNILLNLNAINIALYNIIEKLFSLNKQKHASSLLKIAQDIDNVLFPSKQRKKLIWSSNDERLFIIKDALDNIIRKRTPLPIPQNKIPILENILKKIKEMSIKEYTDSSELQNDKKFLLSSAFDIHPTIAELIGLLLKPIQNTKELSYITNIMKKKATPFLLKKQQPISDYYISPIFKEMLKKYAKSL